MSQEPQWMKDGVKPPKYDQIKQVMTELQSGQIDLQKANIDLDQIEANNEEVEYVESEMNS